MKKGYVLLTPVKNEYLYFQKTISSVLNQEMKPLKWIIIDDGSTDGTTGLIEALCKAYDWITAVHNEPESTRKPGGEFVLEKGFDLLNLDDYDFIAKMDGDLSFEPNFFRDLLKEFENNPLLGIGSGSCFIETGNKMFEETKARIHTRGPMKVYRTKCFQDIGGIVPMLGWDTIDELKAHQHGWETRTFPHLKILHLRATQSAEGRINGLRNMAKASYYLGYHPLFMLFRGLGKMIQKPYLIGGLAMIAEFFKNYFDRKPQISDPELKQYIRKEQIKRLLGRDTNWS